MKLSDAALLTPKNARFYVGQLGEEKFNQLVAPHLKWKTIGGRRYAVRRSIDVWLGIDKSSEQDHLDAQTLLDRL
jgi:hypothetical protein